MVRYLSRFGPVIAISGQHGRALPSLGAAKASFADDQWQQKVHEWMGQALTVVVAATPDQVRDGLMWELVQLSDAERHARVVLVVAPGRVSSWVPAGRASSPRPAGCRSSHPWLFDRSRPRSRCSPTPPTPAGAATAPPAAGTGATPPPWSPPSRTPPPPGSATAWPSRPAPSPPTPFTTPAGRGRLRFRPRHPSHPTLGSPDPSHRLGDPTRPGAPDPPTVGRATPAALSQSLRCRMAVMAAVARARRPLRVEMAVLRP